MYQKIMVPLDGSELAECVLPYVEAITKGCNVREVIFVRVAETFEIHSITTGVLGLSDEEIKRLDSRSVAVAKKYLDRIVSRLDYGEVSVKTEALAGSAAEKLADYSEKNEVGLIVIATHGRSGISRWVWGSVADRLLRSAPVPVLAIRPPGIAEMYQKIMVPLDGSELAECVLPHVEAIAKGCNVREVIFVRVAEPFSVSPVGGDRVFSEKHIKRLDSMSAEVAKKYLDQVVSRLDYGEVSVKTEVLTGRPAEELADYAAKNELCLIVIATHGRSGLSRWVWGSVADRLLRSASVPVLMVRPPGCKPRA